MMASIINDELFAQQMRQVLNDEMLRAAEPVLQKALKDIETEMRKKLAALVVGVVDRSYRLSRDGQSIVIRVDMQAAQGEIPSVNPKEGRAV